MRDLDEHTITAAVLERFSGTPSPRLRAVIATFDEWNYAIDFLTRTGQKCDDKRQEFILLSDTLGISMLVDAINHRMPDGATQTTGSGRSMSWTRRNCRMDPISRMGKAVSRYTLRDA